MSRNAGFTLVELVVVIVILGILAAFAVPRFTDLTAEARRSALDGQVGAMRSAAALAHSLSLARQLAPGAPVQMEGANVTMVNRYPDAPGMAAAANLTPNAEFQFNVFGNVAIIVWATGTGGWNSCGFIYVRAIPPGFPLPRYFGPNTGGC